MFVKIESLDYYLNLKLINFHNNRIRKIDGLKNCSILKVLLLDENYIEKIDKIELNFNLNRNSIKNQNI